MTKFDQRNQKSGMQLNADTINVYLSQSLEVLQHSKAVLKEVPDHDDTNKVFNVVPNQEPSENTKKLIEKFGFAKSHFADFSRQQRDENIEAENSGMPKQLLSMIVETSKCKLAEERLKMSVTELEGSIACDDEGIDPRVHGLETSENAGKYISDLMKSYTEDLKTLSTTIREIQHSAMTPIRNIRT